MPTVVVHSLGVQADQEASNCEGREADNTFIVSGMDTHPRRLEAASSQCESGKGRRLKPTIASGLLLGRRALHSFVCHHAVARLARHAGVRHHSTHRHSAIRELHHFHHVVHGQVRHHRLMKLAGLHGG